MVIIQEVPRHFARKKQKRKISLLRNACVEISIFHLKTSKLTNQPENKSAERHTQIPLLSHQIDSKSYMKKVHLVLRGIDLVLSYQVKHISQHMNEHKLHLHYALHRKKKQIAHMSFLKKRLYLHEFVHGSSHFSQTLSAKQSCCLFIPFANQTVSRSWLAVQLFLAFSLHLEMFAVKVLPSGVVNGMLVEV